MHLIVYHPARPERIFVQMQHLRHAAIRMREEHLVAVAREEEVEEVLLAEKVPAGEGNEV